MAASEAPVARLGDAERALALLFEALTGKRAAVLAEEELAEGLIAADTEATIRLPLSVSWFPTMRENRDWYALAVAHRAGHLAFSSFDLDLAAVLDRLLVDPARLGELGAADGRSPARQAAWPGYYALFARPSLARAVFGAVEDLRVDCRLGLLAPGLVGALERAQRRALADRPALFGMPARAQALEVLVEMTLGATGRVAVASEVAAVLARMAAFLAAVIEPGATVADAAIAAAGLYRLIDALPATYLGALEVALPSPSQLEPAAAAAERAAFGAGRFPEARSSGFEGEAAFEVSVARVPYRDVIGLRYWGVSAGVSGAHEQLLVLGPPGEDEGHGGGGGEHRHLRPEDGDRKDHLGVPEPLPHEHHELPDLYWRHRLAPGRGDGRARRYPEWDYLERRYRQAWATVREEIAECPQSAGDLLERMAGLAGAARRLRVELSRLVPEARRTVRRVRDGGELDFDGGVEALVDLACGSSSEPRPYQRVERSARDVAAAIVIDLSSSTADAAPSGGAPASSGQRPLFERPERIVDREREAVALLGLGLAELGDAFGVYGFSGTGRHDVRVITVKPLGEPPSPRFLARLSGLQPIHMTRLAPVVRHVTGLLQRHGAQTRLLMVICDGRPLDIDYGDHHGEKVRLAYALEDTRAAIEEARAVGVRPFVVAIDGAGREYLSTMLADDASYVVIADTDELPGALLRAYRQLRLLPRLAAPRPAAGSLGPPP